MKRTEEAQNFASSKQPPIWRTAVCRAAPAFANPLERLAADAGDLDGRTLCIAEEYQHLDPEIGRHLTKLKVLRLFPSSSGSPGPPGDNHKTLKPRPEPSRCCCEAGAWRRRRLIQIMSNLVPACRRRRVTPYEAGNENNMDVVTGPLTHCDAAFQHLGCTPTGTPTRQPRMQSQHCPHHMAHSFACARWVEKGSFRGDSKHPGNLAEHRFVVCPCRRA